MIRVMIEGVLLGLIIAVTLGPAFFTIIQTSIDRGFKSALLMSFGIIMSDMVLIVLAYIGLSNLIEYQKGEVYFGIIAGVILIMYGVYTFLKKPEVLKRRSSNYKTPLRAPHRITYIAKGFVLNLFNPFIWVFWFTAMSYVTQRAEYGKLFEDSLAFFSGTVITVFCTDLLKSFIGYKIKGYLKPRIQLHINRGVGISLVVFGIIIIVRVFFF